MLNYAVPKLSPINLAGVFKVYVVLDTYQIIARRQRKGTIQNLPRVGDIINTRKLNDITPWVHNAIKLKKKGVSNDALSLSPAINPSPVSNSAWKHSLPIRAVQIKRARFSVEGRSRGKD